MKILLTSDWHLRNTNPENRIDSFFETQLNKIGQIFQLADDNGCDYILQAGDFWNSSRPSFETIEEVVYLFNQYKINRDNFICVYGQHDLHFRTKERTALKLLEALKYVTIPVGCKILSDNVDLYTASWGADIPIIKDKDNFNILLIHKTILDKPTFPGQEDFLQSDKFFKQEFDVTCCGDFHHPVYYKNKNNQTVLGCGSIVRMTISEADLVPHVYILEIKDDLSYSLEKIILDYKPAEKVFKPEALTREVTKENQKMKEFIESIKNNSLSDGLDFKKNLDSMLLNIEKSVKDIILKELENIK